MYPTVALVGRPNVGKSTLFNKLTGSRDALVADVPGLTRDRRYGRMTLAERTINLIDTGGLFGEQALSEPLTRQTRVAVAEADLIVLILDGREGITTVDEEVVTYLRKEGVDFVPVVNKLDGVSETMVTAEFAKFGFSEPLMISAAHSRGLHALKELLHDKLLDMQRFSNEPPLPDIPGVKVAVVGRPNVGKSTLVNRLLGEDRQVVFDMPGTTKDAIDIPFTADGVDYVLIDTAGVRRKGKVDEVTEKFSVVKALEAMQRCHVVVLVIDAREGVVEQDLHVLTHALDAGAAMFIAVNKWDGLNETTRARAEATLARRMAFIPWVPTRKISALHGTGVGNLLSMVNDVYAAGEFDVTTSLLTRLVRNMVAAHPAPAVRGRQIKIKVATRAGQHPPKVIIHGNQLESLPASYRKYLENGMREALDLVGNPIKLEFRDSENPYAGRRNKLSPRQEAQRGRVIKHRKERAKSKRRKVKKG